MLTFLGLILALFSLTPTQITIDKQGQLIIGNDGISFIDIRNITSIYESYEITRMKLSTTLKCKNKVKLLLINSSNDIMKEIDLIPNNTTFISIERAYELIIITFIGPKECSIDYSYSIYGFEYSNLWLAIPSFALGIIGGYMGIRGVVGIMTKRER